MTTLLHHRCSGPQWRTTEMIVHVGQATEAPGLGDAEACRQHCIEKTKAHTEPSCSVKFCHTRIYGSKQAQARPLTRSVARDQHTVGDSRATRELKCQFGAGISRETNSGRPSSWRSSDRIAQRGRRRVDEGAQVSALQAHYNSLVFRRRAPLLYKAGNRNCAMLCTICNFTCCTPCDSANRTHTCRQAVAGGPMSPCTSISAGSAASAGAW
jgi:hypothetical protein